jgi:hypothetical protein
MAGGIFDTGIFDTGIFDTGEGGAIIREPVQIVEIQQPLCSLAYGVGDCTASGTADLKCYNTRATCQDPTNFLRADPLKLYFSDGDVAEQVIDDAAYIIPSLVSVSTSPTRINPAGLNSDASGLGNRAVCNITFQDHAHTDRVVDPYVDGRSWNPLDADRGSFWTRWMVRNKYRTNIVIKIYEGYSSQSLSQMTSRTYFLQSIDGPNDNGRIRMQGKDILALVEERKAQAPVASPGNLYIAINNTATSFEVQNAVEADYSAAGTIRITDEIMTYTGRATSANGITFTGVTRGTDHTTAQSQDANASVQECLRYSAQRVDDVFEDLLMTYGGIDAAYLDTTNWAVEFDTYMTGYNITTLITEPTSVFDLLAQIQAQTLAYLWWDERDVQVKMKSIRILTEEPPTLTAESHLISGSVSFSEKVRQRTSQIWIYHARNDFTKSLNDAKAYAQLSIIANLETESADLYGEKSVKQIFGNWLPSSALANTTASKIITRFIDPPIEVKFRLDAKDRQYWIGDAVRISHHLDVNQYGARRVREFLIVSAEEKVSGEVIEYTAESVTAYGQFYYIQASGAANYPGVETAAFDAAYIGDTTGVLSDGNPSAQIAS